MPDSYFLLGGNVSNSPSPPMMNAAFEALGLDAVYRVRNVGADDIGTALAELRRLRASGANITIPHKTAAVPLLDSLDVSSSKIGAVNTLKREGRGLVGYDTDTEGILTPLKSRGISKVNRALVMGTGGAARAFCAAADSLGCGELAVISRDPGRADGFLSAMKAAVPEMDIRMVPVGGMPPWSPDLIFNASPAGANGIALPVQAARLVEERPVVFDAVYSPAETDLIRLARDRGSPVVYGHEMLLHQGARSLQIWTGHAPPLPVMKAALLDFLEAPGS